MHKACCAVSTDVNNPSPLRAVLDPAASKFRHHEGHRTTIDSKVGIMTGSRDERRGISRWGQDLPTLARWKKGICHTMIGVVDEDIDRAKGGLCPIKE